MRAPFLAFVSAVALVCVPASASVLLTIDLSTPNEITITSTGGTSISTISGLNETGFYLAGLTGVGNAPWAVDTFGTLSGPSNFSSFEQAPSSDARLYRDSATDPGLNVYFFADGGALATVSFTTGQQAFQGTATWTIPAEFYDFIVANGAASGDIYFPADSLGDLQLATLIGTYDTIIPVVIPEPSRCVMVMAGMVSFLLVRRRR